MSELMVVVDRLTKTYGRLPRVGLWAKTDSTSYFKDYIVESR